MHTYVLNLAWEFEHLLVAMLHGIVSMEAYPWRHIHGGISMEAYPWRHIHGAMEGFLVGRTEHFLHISTVNLIN